MVGPLPESGKAGPEGGSQAEPVAVGGNVRGLFETKLTRNVDSNARKEGPHS